MGLKDFLSVLGNCTIVSLIFFTMLCSAAPAKLAEDREVLSWLEDWTEKLGKSAQETFTKYQDVHFSRRKNSRPLLRLGILRHSFTTISNQKQNMPEKVSEAICRQLMKFTGPVYLALYDESQRLNSNADLTRLLLNVSVTLNSTLEMARYLHVRKFPNAQPTQVVNPWTRSTMFAKVNDYKVKAEDQASINALRSWATLYDVMKFYNTLMDQDLYRYI